MWPLGMEPLPPTHLNGVQQALADWCARHVHMGGIHVHWVGLPAGGQRHSTFRTGGRPTPTCAPGTHTCTVLAVECGLLWGTHTPGVRLGTRGRSVLSSRRRPAGRLCPLASAAPPVPLLFLPGPSRSLCFYSLRASDALVSGVTFAGSF